jgi:hypothetical protein
MSIPRYPDDVTREWLSTVLNRGDTRATLSDVHVTAIGTGQTAGWAESRDTLSSAMTGRRAAIS